MSAKKKNTGTKKNNENISTKEKTKKLTNEKKVETANNDVSKASEKTAQNETPKNSTEKAKLETAKSEVPKTTAKSVKEEDIKTKKENKTVSTKKQSSNNKTNINAEKKVSASKLSSNDKANNAKKSNTVKSEKNAKPDSSKKSKEEEIVFKNSKSKKTENTSNVKPKEDKKIEEKKEEPKQEENHGKKITIIVIATVILVVLLVFSICFALVHATKNTIARGITIKNIDVSNMNYNEAKSKLDEVFGLAAGLDIELKYNDFSYIITAEDIALNYDITPSLEEAYNVGRSGNIFQNNYELIGTSIFNKNINVDFTYDENSLNTIIEYVSTNIPNLVKQYSYYVDGSNLVITPGTDGIEVDREKLKNQIIEIIQNRDLTNISSETQNDKLEIPYNEVKANAIDVEAIYNEVKCDPQDAYYVEATETTKFEIHADVDGIDFAVSMDEAKAIVQEAGKEQYTIPLTITKANVTINDIGIEAFPYQVSKAETTYDASNRGRSENLRIATSKINGTVIMPGEQFSFNGVVGERTVSEGYQDAAIYSDGQVVNGLAGGICQVSSTLYNAVLSANLQVDERYNHSFTTSYAKPGKDATVVYGVKDLKFTNTRTYPIKIEASVGGGVCTFEIYGIEEEKEYDVKIIPVTTSTTPYTVQTVVDNSLAPGQTRVSQAGANGCKVTTYKEVYLNGVQISREVISNDTYQVMTRIIRVGPTE